MTPEVLHQYFNVITEHIGEIIILGIIVYYCLKAIFGKNDTRKRCSESTFNIKGTLFWLHYI